MEELNKEDLHLYQEVRLVTRGGTEIVGKIRALTVQKIKVAEKHNYVHDYKWKDVIKVYKAEPDIDYCACGEKASYRHEKDGKDTFLCEKHYDEDKTEENGGCVYCHDQTELKLIEEKTNRGFSTVKFKDKYGDKCSIQKSSLATENAVWFGIDDPNPQIMAKDTPQGGNGWVPYKIPKEVVLSTRMHLTQLQMKQLLPALQHFAETGEVNGNPKR